ncbi:MAG: TatD family hydrolase [Deltaproteobacteria bacterium]|uniref:TatD family hydrolase n=1 Tax=Candidatus Zymogenus saltonus TaxID=2844893 RepID=A0A9D8KJW7_9DELT|nr:TatD family hydrolase [Candidatus Zymogenus saltonus]
MLIDSHAHLDLPQFDGDRVAVIERAFADVKDGAGGLTGIVTIGFDLNSSKKAVQIAEANDNIYAVVGVHPHDAKAVTERTIEGIRDLTNRKKVVGIGETGLDLFRKLSPVDRQYKAFHSFLDLSGETALPIVIHDRDANAEVLEVLTKNRGDYTPGIIHCFSGDWGYARKCLDLDFYISIPGVVTFPKAKQLHDVVKRLPTDRILFETDAPFLTPAPFRGKRNEPAYVRYTAVAAAEIRGDFPEKLMEAAALNTIKVFGIEEL